MAGVDPNDEWLGYVQPVGLVVAPIVLARYGLTPEIQTRADTEAMRAFVSPTPDDGNGKAIDPRALKDPWAFFHGALGWRVAQVAGVPGGPALPEDLILKVEESDTEIAPHWAVVDPDCGWQILVRVEAPGVRPDERGALAGWEATPHQRFERLLREKQTPIGLLVTDDDLRLIYAPRGETSGWMTFPLRSLIEVGGRPMLSGLKLLLSSFRLHNDAPERRLPALLKASRDAQAEVSIRLAAQVLGALHELLRGLHAADRERIETLAGAAQEHLYDGLLAVLLRLVFLLYAEDRDLIPSRADAEARAFYAQGYGVRSLYGQLLDDRAHHPDTMDERRGAWGRLLALFALLHHGDSTRIWIRGRGGLLFDPTAFPFLQGQDKADDPLAPAPVSDGCILRILDLLITVDGEKLSYRTLDVEQIGSVYETVMGFTIETRPGPAVAIKAGKNDRTPVFVDIAELAAAKGSERTKYLKEKAGRNSLSDKVVMALSVASGQPAVLSALSAIVDERGSPGGHLSLPGTPLLQPTDERRRTGSHYTPRSLTGPIVRHALEPAFERIGPDAKPEDVLALKVCDPAMGSGAFLVEACRALGDRLVHAWARWPETRPRIPEDEDEPLHARRLVAQRCLYGVDKNPRAVELAKLSLWLATLARDHEFTFLDHALKSGDSLVGLTQAQIAAAHWDASKPGLPLFRHLLKERVAEAMKGRAEIQAAPDDTARVIQEARHRSLEARLKGIRLIGDAVIAAFFAEDNPKTREKKRSEVESWLGGSPVAWDKLAAMDATLKEGAHPLTPFHWGVEFPEAFARDSLGFDAIVGNPPFSGGTHLERIVGRQARNWMVTYIADGARGIRGAVDLSAYFFLRCFGLLNSQGCLGLVATNSISQGDSRVVGLQAICDNSGSIYRAVRSQPWPGEAATHISMIWIAREQIEGRSFVLDGKEVAAISSGLGSQVFGHLEPFTLQENNNLAFKGATILGSGFIISMTEANSLLEDVKYGSVVYQYLIGEDVNTDPKQRASRWVINFKDLPLGDARSSELTAQDFPKALAIVEERVKPGRTKLKQNNSWNRGLKARWWQFGLWRPALEHALRGRDSCLVISRVTAHHCFARVDTRGIVFSDRLVVIANAEWSWFSILSSGVHHTWAHRPGSTTQGTTLNYLSARSFLTFPRPRSSSQIEDRLSELGSAYHDHRAALMVVRNEGMTKTYNRFHDPAETAEDIQRLRELHADMDHAVLEAYGWHDLADRAEPIYLDETNEDDHTYQGRLFWPSAFRDEVLSRLLALNAERAAAEKAAGLSPLSDRDEDQEEVEV